MRLDGKVALITGGGSGMGKVASELFVAEGANVVLTDVNDEAGGGDREPRSATAAHYVHADVSLEADAKMMVAATIERYGRLDVLYNNAGVMLPDDGSVDAMDERIWDIDARRQREGRRVRLQVRDPRDARHRRWLDHQRRVVRRVARRGHQPDRPTRHPRAPSSR